jgi:predicted Ser/Thr protein kinase
MGAVYRARQKKLGRVVALKLLHADLSADPAFVARFLREASALARLAHPGIVAIYEYGEQGARCWLLMEYVDGTNLRALLREKKLEPRQALAIVRQLCDALQFAHDEGVVHRDIKPENVLVDRRGSVKLADFGLAKLVGAPEAALTQVDQVMGTPHYMAPEQVEHPRDVDHRADIYSLGVVFYEMLTGELPLGRFAPPSKRVEVDVRLDEIVLRSLEHERERRYQHAAQVKTDVQHVESAPAPSQAAREEHEKSRVFEWGFEGGQDGLRMVPGKHAPTSQGWFTIGVATWAVCGASFNLGAFGFGFVSVPLLAWLFLALVRHRAGWTPPVNERALGKRRAEALTCFLFGALALFGAHLAAWDKFTWNYVAPAASGLTALESLAGREYESLRTLGVPLDLARIEPELQLQSAHMTDLPGTWLQSWAGLGLAALALLAAAAWCWARPARKDAARLLTASLGLFLGPLIAVESLTATLQGFRQSVTGLHAGPLESGQELEFLTGRLYDACLEENWRVSAQHDARIVDRLSGATLAEVRTLVAAPLSPFERWRLAWRGPERQAPQVVIIVLSTELGGNNHRTLVYARAGLGEPEFVERWNAKLAALLRRANG